MRLRRYRTPTATVDRGRPFRSIGSLSASILAVMFFLAADKLLAGESIRVFRDYTAAYEEAEKTGSVLLLVFEETTHAAPPGDVAQAPSEEKEQGPEAVPAGQVSFVFGELGIPRGHPVVCAVLTPEAKVRTGGQTIRLLDHPVFKPLEGRPGVAVIDFSDGNKGVVSRLVPAGNNPRFYQQLVDVLAGRKVSESVPPPTSEARPSHAGSESPKVERPPCFRTYALPICNFTPLPVPIQWHTSYAAAYRQAKEEQRPLLVYFRQDDRACEKFDSVLDDQTVVPFLRFFVCARLPLDARVGEGDNQKRLLDEPGFAEMLGLPGIAIIDLVHKDRPYYGQVVSTFPFLHGRPYTVEQTLIILTLPPGTLTQRTLIYAVRSHPERPRSADGTFDPFLAAEATSHAAYQAQLGVQGHHFWETRFHRILSRLPFGLVPQEVCAESWPGQNLLESAIECVRCWRLSSGHWSAVSRYHPYFGYDMQRGRNGVWYATGIFAKGGILR